MSCGKAVIASNVSSLPEVTGDAGLLINPCSTDELCEAIYKLIQDDSLRCNLEKMALARSKMFSWDKMARQTVEIYEKCYA
jgi:alpha-1,3-rhamnosyl/mannosyltransferase